MPVRLCIGDAVLVYMSEENNNTSSPPQNMKEENIRIGIIKYIGFIEGFEMTEYVGLELVECISNGHNGIINGIQYFTSKKGHGIHTRITNVIRKLNASEVTIKMQELIMLFKQRMNEYLKALTERDEYINQLTNEQDNLRRLFKEHCSNNNININIDNLISISPKININKFNTIIDNNSPSFSFLNYTNLQKHTFNIGTFKSTKMQQTESEGDISIASMNTDLSEFARLTNTKRDSSVVKLNTIDETLTAKIDLDPNTLVKGLDILSNPMTPVTPITPAESFQSDSEILHATKMSPDLSSLNKRTQTPTKLALKTRYGLNKKQEFPDTEKINHEYYIERSKKRRQRINANRHKTNKMRHRRSSSEQNVHNHNYEYTKYVTRNNYNKSKSRRNIKSDKTHELYAKRSIETEDTQSVSSYESSYDSNYDEEFEECSNYNEETEFSDYYSSDDQQYNTIYSSRSVSKNSKHKNKIKYKKHKKHKYKNKNKKQIIYKNNMKHIGLKNQSNSEQIPYPKNRYLHQYNNNNMQPMHHNAHSMNSNLPNSVYMNQQPIAHPLYQSQNNSNTSQNTSHNSPSSQLGSPLPQSYPIPTGINNNVNPHGQFSMSTGNLRQLAMVNHTSHPPSNTHVNTHNKHSSNHSKKVSQKRQVKFVTPVLELRDVNTYSGGMQSNSNNYNKATNHNKRKLRLKKDNHRRSSTWDPVAGGGLLPQHEIAVVQTQQQLQQRNHIHHQVQYSSPTNGYYPQPAIDDWMQHQMQQQQQHQRQNQQQQQKHKYFHHN